MELSKNYNPAAIEEKWTKHWREKGYFKSTPDDRKPFTVVIPPPNVTGVLHMGHTLNETVQDILVRRARMSGFNACWVPGSDHASIATEARVVNMLKEKGINKNDLSREEFLKYAFEWKEKYGDIIYSQIEKLGCSVDWDRVNFTMDDHYNKAVIKIFAELHEKGLIYRDKRMVNWDPKAKTALSDEEVNYREVQGKLYFIKYKIQDSTENIVIATVRPETILGDTAICVHPDDPRYLHLHNKYALVPIINRPIKIIADEYVDKEFGTGALKITPAHDKNDYEIGLKYDLAQIDILNDDGTMSKFATGYEGLNRFVARNKIVIDLKEQGYLLKTEDYVHQVGFSERTNEIVEPALRIQWWVNMKSLAEPALKAVMNDEINLHPSKFRNLYSYWMENIRDWCISRHLWWGLQIPAWYDSNGNVYVAESKEEAVNKYLEKNPKSEITNLTLTQDEDVLDTWFSSWLWPIEVFNGITNPDNRDFNYYYPTSVLVTGQDIIFFWVARMIMAGYEFKKEKPFSDVYFTGMVRDKLGRKMSKSLGNSPDLLELIDKYGADAVRFGILISSPAGNDLLFDEASLEQGRNFNNKLWNALKLVRSWEARVQSSEPGFENFATEWFENRLNEAKKQIEDLFKDFKLSEALKILYSLIWDDFCSWYLEWAKPEFEKPIDKTVYEKTVHFFEELIQLLHPFMPFITEEIYHLLKERNDDLCMKQYEKIREINADIFEKAKLVKDVITRIRDAQKQNNIPSKTKMLLSITTNKPHLFEQIIPTLFKQLNLETISVNDVKKIGNLNNIPVIEDLNNLDLIIDEHKFNIKASFAINIEKQKKEIINDLEYQKGFLQTVLKKLGNERFVQNAKPEVIALEQKKKADAEAKIKVLEESLSNL